VDKIMRDLITLSVQDFLDIKDRVVLFAHGDDHFPEFILVDYSVIRTNF